MPKSSAFGGTFLLLVVFGIHFLMTKNKPIGFIIAGWRAIQRIDAYQRAGGC